MNGLIEIVDALYPLATRLDHAIVPEFMRPAMVEFSQLIHHQTGLPVFLPSVWGWLALVAVLIPATVAKISKRRAAELAATSKAAPDRFVQMGDEAPTMKA